MGRMHAPGKGISQSALPYRRSVPTWLKITPEEVKEHITKHGKKGLTPSQIGVILRDSLGVAQVRFLTGSKILRIMKSMGLAPDLPEDLYYLIKKAVAIRKHLEKNRKDKAAIESVQVDFFEQFQRWKMQFPFQNSLLVAASSLQVEVGLWAKSLLKNY